jgi:hypothetical protein
MQKSYIYKPRAKHAYESMKTLQRENTIRYNCITESMVCIEFLDSEMFTENFLYLI